MKKLVVYGLVLAITSAATPRIAASFGYEAASIQDNMRMLKDSLDSVTKAMGR